jgi:hypothetical protein
VRLRFLPVAVLVFAAPAVARAEPTSWFAVGGGFALERNTVIHQTDNAFALDTAVGVGTSPTGSFPIVVGGVFRAVGYVNLGADMNLSLRLATKGYSVGDYGLALDLGAGARLWGTGAYGNIPMHVALTAGVPFGFQVVVGADGGDLSLANKAAWGGFAAIEFDFLRLTTMRSGETTKLWPNPSPANAPPAPTPALP